MWIAYSPRRPKQCYVALEYNVSEWDLFEFDLVLNYIAAVKLTLGFQINGEGKLSYPHLILKLQIVLFLKKDWSKLVNPCAAGVFINGTRIREAHKCLSKAGIEPARRRAQWVWRGDLNPSAIRAVINIGIFSCYSLPSFSDCQRCVRWWAKSMWRSNATSAWCCAASPISLPAPTAWLCSLRRLSTICCLSW